jgi:phosphoglycerol transferase MdoB-like AlkP superfamily enzyme
VLRCTSKRLGAFVDWVERQPFGENTEIVIAGDHLFMAKSPVAKMRLRDRRFLNIYLNPKYSSEQTRRTYTSFDSAPTLLETMGFHIEGHRLGFGASLLSDERTLLESFGEIKLVHMLRELSGSIEYNELFKNKAP